VTAVTRVPIPSANRIERDRLMGLTRSGPNYSAIKGRKIRPNPIALILKAGKNGVHEGDSIASADGRQTETARSARKSFAYAPRVTLS